jgi:hypothetical protein
MKKYIRHEEPKDKDNPWAGYTVYYDFGQGEKPFYMDKKSFLVAMKEEELYQKYGKEIIEKDLSDYRQLIYDMATEEW